MENVEMKSSVVDPLFWRGKKVFLTGHTGFKGSWLSLWLSSMGAKVTGYALSPNTSPNLFNVIKIAEVISNSCIADIRDLSKLRSEMIAAEPDIVIHMAAQPLVRYSYQHPVETYATNVMGTVHVLESTRALESIKATVVVTTDKCYENKEWLWGYRENEAMGGHDPYSSSKGCAEIVAAAYRNSFFSGLDSQNSIATARAGNVIGGGDWSPDRLIPDAIKAFESNQAVRIRNPLATRPWQHVLEPLSGYLILAQQLYSHGSRYASSWNFGPQDEGNRSVKEVIELMALRWGGCAQWEKDGLDQPHEANLLKLDCSKARQSLGWMPRWGLETAIEKIVEWQKSFQSKADMCALSVAQIEEYTKS
jgi:CDP-glucose 4,6-dehydratase